MERGCYQGDRHGDRDVGDFHLEEDQSPQHHQLHRHDREAYDALDPTGNITIKWDIISWTADGYVTVVSIFNFQQYRHIQAPGWQLGWSWYKKEVIWSMVGAQATEQGDCSKFKGNIPHCCKKTPTVVDLLPGTPYNQHISNCCRGAHGHKTPQQPWEEQPPAALAMYTAYVSHQSSLACENELQRVLVCEGHNHKLQLQYELLAVEFGCSASQLRQYHSAFQLYIPTTLDSDLVRFELVIK
ncbi:hypothetical protein HID58_077616, partial [Brassica napus]